MSLRSICRPAICKNIVTVLSRQSWQLHTTSAFGPTTFTRGAKRKTVVKLKDLPQGALGPLPDNPKHEADNVPADDAQTRRLPPAFHQHYTNMRKYPDCVLLTRIGDFYELYFEDVPKYAPLLGLKQTTKGPKDDPIPMAGFKHEQLDKYTRILVQDHNLKVAIAEQVKVSGEDESPRFDRPVKRILTKGTLIDESFIEPYENSYLLGIHIDGLVSSASTSASDEVHDWYRRTTKVGVSWLDLSSGDFFVQTSDFATLPSLVARIAPREIVFHSSMETTDQIALQKLLGEIGWVFQFHHPSQAASSVAEWASMLEKPVSAEEVPHFTAQELAAGNLVLDYVRDKLHDENVQLQPPVRRSDDDFMAIDKQSLRGLEIKSLIRDGSFKGSLLHAIRRTVTRSGARLLNQRITSPSMSLSVINNRLDLVDEMLSHEALREDVTALLERTTDTFRLLQRFSINRGDADDLLSLARTVEVMSQMSEILHDHILAGQRPSEAMHSDKGCLWDVLERLDLEGPNKLAKAILTAIDEEGLTRQHNRDNAAREEAEGMTEEVVEADAAGETVPQLTRRGSKAKPPPSVDSPDLDSQDICIMRRNASPALEAAHRQLDEVRKDKLQLLLQLKKQFNLDTLVFDWSLRLGHICRIKGKDVKVDLSKVHGVQSVSSTKHTRTFHSAELTALGDRIDGAKSRIRSEEERMFGKLRAQVIQNIVKLRRNAAVLDELDVACSSAIVAKERNLKRPEVDNTTSHHIIGGRHPTVDIGLKEQGRPFTSNDCFVGDSERIYLLTGPNMGGKSTYLRQNTLITILAQTGCFVPAEYARIGLVDKIFSRVGSADNLYQDQSTFMVEMMETAEILKRATPRSFVIMDEVGRGTTPEDGLAVSYACLHHIHHVNKCRTLFATHFHALADITVDFDDLSCYCTDIAEEGDGGWAYLHRLRPGVNRTSHALKVARMAGMPDEAIGVASDVLKTRGFGDSQESVRNASDEAGLAAMGGRG